MVLLSVLVQVRMHEELGGKEKSLEAIAASLDSFVAHGDVLGRLASPDCILGSSSLPGDHVVKCVFQAEQCDEALKAALRALQEVQGNSKTLLLEMAFIDGLREWPALLKSFAQGPPADLYKPCRCIDFSPHWSWMMAEQRRSALRNATSWLLSLLYSVYFADCNSVCVVCVSFVFSSSFGRLWDRNLNRFLGVGIGVCLGNLPSWVCFGGESYKKDAHHPADLVSYLVMMFVIWLAATYGYFDGGRWSYSYCLLAGIGGVKLLQPLGTDSRGIWRTGAFNTMMDTLVACLITFVVDMFYGWLWNFGTRHTVANTMGDVLIDTVRVVESLLNIDQTFGVQDLRQRTDLQTSADSRRRFHERVFQAKQAHEEALLKEATWQIPYKARLAESLLKEFDAISVATFGIRSSAERCDRTRLKALLQRTIPHRLMGQGREYARTAIDAFRQKTHKESFSLAEIGRSGTRRTSILMSEGFQAGLLQNGVHYVDDLSAKYPSEDGASSTADSMSHGHSVEEGMMPAATWNTNNLEEDRFRTVWKEVRSACEECESESVEVLSATLAAMTGVLALRLAMGNIEVLLRDEEYWSFGHWGFDDGSAMERLRSYCPEKAHFARPHRRVKLHVPKIISRVSSRLTWAASFSPVNPRQNS